jgi:hypothetical protein
MNQAKQGSLYKLIDSLERKSGFSDFVMKDPDHELSIQILDEIRHGFKIPFKEAKNRLNKIKKDALGARIVIYGASISGEMVYHELKDCCKIVAVIDMDPAKKVFCNSLDVNHPSILKKLDFDLIILATSNRYYVKTMKDELARLGISLESVVSLGE